MFNSRVAQIGEGKKIEPKLRGRDPVVGGYIERVGVVLLFKSRTILRPFFIKDEKGGLRFNNCSFFTLVCFFLTVSVVEDIICLESHFRAKTFLPFFI